MTTAKATSPAGKTRGVDAVGIAARFRRGLCHIADS